MGIMKKLLAGAAALAVGVGAVQVFPVEAAYTYSDFSYDYLEDGTIEITGYSGDADSVNIPAEINGTAVTSIGMFAFSCDSFQSVTIPDSVTSIGYYAFSLCTNLTSVTIPDSVINIGDNSFQKCDELKSVFISDSVMSIGDSAFYNCGSLSAIDVDSDNKYYSSMDGVLFDKQQAVLIHYPIGSTRESYTVPGNVTRINEGAFWGADLLSVTVPDNVTSIGQSAFRYCSNMSITILNPYCEIYDSDITIYDCDVVPSADAAICGYNGSTAENYAEKYYRNFVSLGDPIKYNMGDADGNGSLNLDDASAALTHYAMTAAGLGSSFTYPQQYAADINADGAVNLDDASYILSYYAQTAAGLAPAWDDICPVPYDFPESAYYTGNDYYYGENVECRYAGYWNCDTDDDNLNETLVKYVTVDSDDTYPAGFYRIYENDGSYIDLIGEGRGAASYYFSAVVRLPDTGAIVPVEIVNWGCNSFSGIEIWDYNIDPIAEYGTAAVYDEVDYSTIGREAVYTVRGEAASKDAARSFIENMEIVDSFDYRWGNSDVHSVLVSNLDSTDRTVAENGY